MRPLLLLLLCVALVGCGGVAATPIPTPVPPSATRVLNEMEEAGLLVHRVLGGSSYLCAITTGMQDYQEFTQRDLPGELRYAVVSFDTPQHAEAARGECSKRVGNFAPTISAWRRGTVILIWRFAENGPFDGWHPYFSVLQSVR